MNSKKIIAQRRAHLIKNVQEHYKTHDGIILVLANFEAESTPYRQESTFFYYTGIQEPASALMLNCATGTSTLFVPHTGERRAAWFADAARINKSYAHEFDVDEVRALGAEIPGHSLPLLHEPGAHTNLAQELQAALVHDVPIFTCMPKVGARYNQQILYIQQLCAQIPGLTKQFFDISALVGMQRAIKDETELKEMLGAIGLTLIIQNIVQENIDNYLYESHIQAEIRRLIAAATADLAFEPIVASGSNSCIIHYQQSARKLAKQEVIIVDCGARINGYCADITRTYVVGKKYTKQQQEIFDLVAQAQQFVATHARPGMYLNNAEKPEASLNDLMKNFFIQHGHTDTVKHGIGHFVGLDAHDVGNPTLPLQPGMVITIEPGLYLPNKNFGMRIEDDFLITADGVQNLSAYAQ